MSRCQSPPVRGKQTPIEQLRDAGARRRIASSGSRSASSIIPSAIPQIVRKPTGKYARWPKAASTSRGEPRSKPIAIIASLRLCVAAKPPTAFLRKRLRRRPGASPRRVHHPPRSPAGGGRDEGIGEELPSEDVNAVRVLFDAGAPNSVASGESPRGQGASRSARAAGW